MRTLVTGGAGFIGSNLVDALLARGDEVTVLDDLSTGRRKNLDAALAAGATLVEGSVADPAAVAAALEAARPEVIHHLAAQIDVRRAVEDPAFDATINVVGTATLLEAARRAGVRRVVLASTGGAIYGDADVLPTPEGTEPKPLSPYAASKAAAEVYMDLYRRLYGLSTFSLRLANVYGPRQDPKGEAGVVAIYCGRALNGGVATVFGDGLQTRDFVYVGDVVRAFMAAGDGDAAGYCNVSTGRETTVLELADVLSLRPEHEPERAGEVRRSCLDPTVARRVLGWTAETPLRAGLEQTVAAARDE
ncbi:MAG TPA: NAD-dependent epimerase/dehydratase family protein [Solirubrobacteraceae bacterium]|nr:NAD-dependent epimerase/dehydratase family protein [Solirubrobacteraceae bacterium]